MAPLNFEMAQLPKVRCLRFELGETPLFSGSKQRDVNVHRMGGGFKHFLCLPLPGEMIQLDIFFRWLKPPPRDVNFITL